MKRIVLPGRNCIVMTLALTFALVFAVFSVLIPCSAVFAESPAAWAGGELIYIGEVRGNRFMAVTYSNGETEYAGIMDLRGGFAVEPSASIVVAEGQSKDNGSIQYFGGKNTGVYWIENIETDRVAFLDVPSGYLSGFLFGSGTDPWFDDPETDFLRITEDGVTYAYINRRNGEFLTGYIFQQMNLTGFVGSFAVEQMATSGAWVVVNRYGGLIPLPLGCVPVDWYDGLDENLRIGRILLQREDGSTFFYEVELPQDSDAPFDYDTREHNVSEAALTAVAARDFPEWTVTAVSLGGFWGCTDDTAAWIIPPQFDSAP